MQLPRCRERDTSQHLKRRGKPNASEPAIATHLKSLKVCKERIKETLLMSSIQNHFAASQPGGLFSKRRSHAETTIIPRHTRVIDHFMLYVLNNIQLPPNVLEEAGLSLKSATGGLNQRLKDNASGAANYKPNSFSGPTEYPASQEPLTKISGHVGRHSAAIAMAIAPSLATFCGFLRRLKTRAFSPI
jgi:hypothetical protein